jgi:hypothetical protein
MTPLIGGLLSFATTASRNTILLFTVSCSLLFMTFLKEHVAPLGLVILCGAICY